MVVGKDAILKKTENLPVIRRQIEYAADRALSTRPNNDPPVALQIQMEHGHHCPQHNHRLIHRPSLVLAGQLRSGAAPVVDRSFELTGFLRAFKEQG